MSKCNLVNQLCCDTRLCRLDLRLGRFHPKVQEWKYYPKEK